MTTNLNIDYMPKWAVMPSEEPGVMEAAVQANFEDLYKKHADIRIAQITDFSVFTLGAYFAASALPAANPRYGVGSSGAGVQTQYAIDQVSYTASGDRPLGSHIRLVVENVTLNTSYGSWLESGANWWNGAHEMSFRDGDEISLYIHRPPEGNTNINVQVMFEGKRAGEA